MCLLESVLIQRLWNARRLREANPTYVFCFSEWGTKNPSTGESEPLADLAVNIENDYNRNRSGRPQLK